MNLRRFIFNFSFFLVAFSATFALGYFTHDLLQSSKAEFVILDEAYEILVNHALVDLPEEPGLEYGMIRGMLDTLGDPHTRFSEPVQTELSNDNLAGSYGGIGASLDRDPEGFIILYPFQESPAKEKGIQDGDRLIQVDDLPIRPETPIDQAVAALRGPEGDPVIVTVTRPPDYKTLTFKIKRQSIPLPSVTWHTAPAEARLGIIEVNLIAASTADEIETAVDDLQSQGAEFFALDLRGNRGGLVDAGVNIARLFLENGDILQEQYRGKNIETYSASKSGSLVELPLVVLVDQNTASAAEIVAGALQVHGRAPIIGIATYGKDTIQLAFELQDGSSMHVTAAKWWIPGLETDIGESGLQPNLLIESTEDQPAPFIETAAQYFTQGE